MSETFEGGCFCGQVRYRLASRPMFTHACHCRECQKQIGSAFVINALIETDRIERLAGEPEVVELKPESGRPLDVYRCPSCQSVVWSDYGRRPGLRFVRVAGLDDPAAIVPDAHIFVRSKVPWVVIPEGHRAFDVFYELESEWPAESLARRQALLDPRARG